MTSETARRISALLIVPCVLVVADIAATRTDLKFLLLPPFAALTYLLFVNPSRVDMNLRRVVVCPTTVALLAWVLASYLGDTPLSVGLVTLGTMLIMWALKAHMLVPPLALALLTLLLHSQVRGKPQYVISVFIFTVVIYVLYLVWDWLSRHETLADARNRSEM